MTGFMPADDRQETLHQFRVLAEYVALFRQAVRDNGIDGPVVDELTVLFYAHVLESSGQKTMADQMADMLRRLRDNEEDE